MFFLLLLHSDNVWLCRGALNVFLKQATGRVPREAHTIEQAMWPVDTTIRKEKKRYDQLVADEPIPQQLHLFTSSTPKTQKPSWLAQGFKKYINTHTRWVGFYWNA